jgi:transcriptional regulator with XRE-family HTH domain
MTDCATPSFKPMTTRTPMKPKRAPDAHAFWRVKRLRELKGLTLEKLADRTGLTKSYLSKIERGVSIPSIATALSLAEAFEVPVGDLFGVKALSNDFLIVRKDQRKPFNGRREGGSDYHYEAIAPGMAHGLYEAFIMRPPRDTASTRSNFQHGGQEMIFVLRGKIEISLPHEKLILNPGDCIIFNARLPHRSRSTGPQQAEALVIVTNNKAELTL